MKTTLFLLLITLNLFANAQNNDCSMWTKTFGGDEMDVAYSIEMTNDNGFIVAGKSHSYGYASSDVLVIKMDSCGNVQWMNTYGDEYDQEIGLSITPTNSGDYLFVGYYVEGFKDQQNILIGKIDSQGNLQWLKKLQNDFWSYAYDIIENNEGNYIIAGSWAVYPGRSQGYIAKLNAYGTILWTKTYGDDMNDAFCSVQQATDGGYIVTGIYNYNVSKVWLIKTNSSGNMVWGNTYTSGGGYSVKETNDGGFVVGGYSDNTNAYLLKTNNLGDTLWTKTIDYGNSSIFRDISLTSDNGYICTGYADYYANERDVLLVKTNNTGDTLWAKTYGGVQDDIGFSVLQYTDGTYAIAGQLEIYKTDHYVSDYWVIKTDNSGNTEYFICDFTGDTINGEYPLSVNFFDQSTIVPGDIVEWEWDFGDGNQSFEQNPSHLYEIPGKYTISLIVKDINNKMDTCIKTDYIDVEYYPPIADFYADTTLGTVPFTVSFFDQSSNGSVPITSYYWDFGDGFNSLETNPVHIYQNGGQFNVSLILTDENDSTGILIKENYITVFESTIDSGDVSGIWTLNNSPYLVNGNINIPLGQELMIEPGVKIVFNGHYKFSVFGRLIAQANQVDSIFIIPLYEDIGWEGIWFQNISTNNQDSSLLKYCHIEGVRYPEFTSLTHSGGIVCDNSADIIIQNCLIKNNYAASGGGGISLINNSDIIIRENTITNNKSGLWSWWAGGGISMRNSNAIVIGNLISHNEAWLGGGIFCSHNSSATIKNNVISYNHGREWGGGIYILSADPVFERNLVSHNSFEYSGGGITIGSSSSTLINNTIANNYHNGTWFSAGGGIYCYYDVNSNIINTIVWDNYPYEICLGDEYSGDDNFVDIDFSDVKDGLNNIQIFNNGYFNWGWGNIISYPLFVDTTDNNYHLQEQSPCIDAGDPNSPFDPDGTIADMGTFYFNQSQVSQQIPLICGYSFVSSRILPDNPDMTIVCDEILDNLDFVRNSSGQILRKIGPNWVNNIGDWIIDEGYLFKMYSDDSFSIEGIAVDPSTPISLSTGFQFVSYFPEAPMDALSAFETILNDNLDLIRNSSGGTLRKIGPNWVNGIGDCMPGEGYLVKMFAEGVIIYPAVAKSSGKMKVLPTHFNFEGGNAADPVYTLYVSGLEIGDEVAAYDGEKPVGAMKINSLNPTDNELAVFNSINNGQGYTPGKSISLKVWSKGEVVNADFTMETVFDSYVADVYPDEDGKYSLVNITKGASIWNNEILVYPNPATDEINISSSEIIKNVIILNYAGQLVYEGNSSTINTTGFNSGIYIIRIKTDNGVETQKITIK